MDGKSYDRNRLIAVIQLSRSKRENIAHVPYFLYYYREAIMVDTGQYRDKYQQRTYADMEGQVANELSQLPNFHAKARLLTGEHTILTPPAPLLLPDSQVQERIRVIKRRMLFLGYTKPYTEVESEIRERQERLRKRPASDAPPPPNTNGKRAGRVKPPPAHT